MNPLFQNHRALQYYPNPRILPQYLNYYINHDDVDGFVNFYNAVGRQYYIIKTTEFYNKAVKFAYENDKKELCVDAYIDIIDYEEIRLEDTVLNKIVYSNAHIIKDRIFIESIEKYLEFHSYDIASIWLVLLLNKKFLDREKEVLACRDQLNNSLEKIDFSNVKKEDLCMILAHEGILKYLTENADDLKTLGINKRIVHLFDDSYKSVVEKISS